MIKLFASDVDGTLTAGCMYYADNGLELKKFNFRDGHGFQLLKISGIKTALITSETSPIVKKRADKLGIDHLAMGCKDKLLYVQCLCENLDISLHDVAYIGDDVNDLELLSAVGVAACPADAHQQVKTIPGIKILSRHGGDAAVREFIDSLLRQSEPSSDGQQADKGPITTITSHGQLPRRNSNTPTS